MLLPPTSVGSVAAGFNKTNSAAILFEPFQPRGLLLWGTATDESNRRSAARD